MILWCRLCAEQKYSAALIASVSELKEKLIKCCRWQETKDVNQLSQRVCDRCVANLDFCWDFVHQVEAAEIKLTELYSKEPLQSVKHEEFTFAQVDHALGVDANNINSESDNEQTKQDIRSQTDICLRRSNRQLNKPDDDGISKTLKGNKESFILPSDESNETNYDGTSLSDSALEEHSPNKLKVHPIGGVRNSQTNKTAAAIEQTSPGKKKSYKFLSRIPNETLLRDGRISDVGVLNLERNFPEMKNISWQTCKYKCNECPQLIIDGSDKFFIHFQSKHYEELDSYRFVCYYCNDVYDSFFKLNRHIGSCIHYIHLRYRCSICPKMYFWDLNVLRKHQRYFHSKPEFKCDQCEKIVFGKVAFYRHTRCVHSMNNSVQNRIYACDICKAIFSTKNRIENHIMVTHAKIKKFVCQYCAKSFGTKATLNYHIEARHIVPENSFTCSAVNCGKQFNTIVKLKAHLLTHGPRKLVVCEHCGNKFVSSQNLKHHIAAKHLDRFYTCPIKGCERKFKWKMSLKNHILRHESSQKLQCNICKKYLAGKKSLRAHMSIHDNNAAKAHECSICKKSFRTKTKLNIHERIHSGLRPFQCPLCIYTSADRGNLDKHTMRIHAISIKQKPLLRSEMEPVDEIGLSG